MSRRPVLLAVATIIVAACAGGDDDAGSEDTSSATTTAAATTDPPEPTTPTTEPTATDPPATTAAPTTTSTSTSTVAPTTTLPSFGDFPVVDAGPYDVGVATVTLIAPGRPLAVDIWFPLGSDVDAATLDPHRYTLLPGVFYESPFARSATPDLAAADGPFPLVVYSHGSGGLRYLHSELTEAIASHGHVVVAPDHLGNTVLERIGDTSLPLEEMALLRLQDVDRMIAAFTDPTQSTVGAYASLVDADRTGVVGHSFGAWTAIASAAGFENEFGAAEPDERVDAIVGLAPALTTEFTDEQLAALETPMLVIAGTNDITTPIDPNVTHLWDSTTNTGYRVELENAAHQTFTDVCAYQTVLPTIPNVPDFVGELIDVFAQEGCSPGDMPAARAAGFTNTYVIEFLDEVFAGEPVDPGVLSPPDDVVVVAR